MIAEILTLSRSLVQLDVILVSPTLTTLVKLAELAELAKPHIQ